MPLHRIAVLPRFLFTGVVASLLCAALVAGTLGANASSRAHTPLRVSNVGLVTTQVPLWLAKWILTHATKEGAKYDLELIGEHCPSLAPTLYALSLCSSDTSPDPARWHTGTVDTGGPILKVRNWSTQSASITRTMPDGWRLEIFCQQTGDRVYGRWGWTNVWDYVGTFGGVPWFVSDGFVYTGSNGFVTGSCTSTNWGNNPF